MQIILIILLKPIVFVLKLGHNNKHEGGKGQPSTNCEAD